MNGLGVPRNMTKAKGYTDILKVLPRIVDEFPEVKFYFAGNIRKGERNIINIASQLDTLTFDSYYTLIKAIDNQCKYNTRDLYIVRRTTQEEDTVLKFIGNDKYYNPDEINWDKKRIKLKH